MEFYAKPNKCPICNSKKGFRLGWDSETITCLGCDGLIFINKSNYKSNDYFEDIYQNYLDEKDAHVKDAEKHFKLVMSSISKAHNKPSTIIEFGSAFGFFLNCFKKRVSVCDVIGVEPDYKAYCYSKETLNLNVHNIKIEDVVNNYPEMIAKSDMIFAWAVLEHLPSIYPLLSNLYDKMKPGSYFFFTTVDASSINAKMRKRKWRLYAPPEHILYPTKKGLSSTLKSLGFSIVEKRYIGNVRAFSKYLTIFGSTFQRSLCNKFPILYRIYLPVNLYDIIFFGVKKC